MISLLGRAFRAVLAAPAQGPGSNVSTMKVDELVDDLVGRAAHPTGGPPAAETAAPESERK
ncbi:MAG: hypothetical protein ACYDBY_07910 [Thermoanaerobaculia bacterium]